MIVYRLTGARQASFGIGTDSPTKFETLRESFGEYDLSVEMARLGGEPIDTLPDDATYEQRWNFLARLEGIKTTWAEQEAVREADRLADEQDD